MLSKRSLSPSLLIDHSEAHLQISIEKGRLREQGEKKIFFILYSIDMVMFRSV